jgi:uncharacterized protein
VPSNRQIIADLYASFARGDAGTVLSGFAPDIVWNEADNLAYADGNPYVGPDAVANGIFMRLVSEWDGFTVTPEKLVEDGDTVVSLGRYRATHKATRQPLDAQFVHVWTIEDGRVTSFQQYTDTLQFARVMGIGQAIPA